MTTSIHPNTKMGAAALVVPDLSRSLDYYQYNIGLRLHAQEGGIARLGVGGDDLLVLYEQPGAKPVQRHHTGLYHFAILVPSRVELGRTLRHLIESRTPIGGASDHAVSEALYLNDPDGHGIEIYRDRPRAEWEYPNGTLRMGTDPLDVEGVLAAGMESNEPWTGMPAGTVIGHMHLHVSDLAAAEQFYRDVIGFDLIIRYGRQASFLSAGGYHHHLGINTWAGIGVPPPPADAARLAWYEITVPDEAALEEVVTRARNAGAALTEEENGWQLLDPAQNAIRLVAAA
jgi:catechol 2,3-dioxygenase